MSKLLTENYSLWKRCNRVLEVIPLFNPFPFPVNILTFKDSHHVSYLVRIWKVESGSKHVQNYDAERALCQEVQHPRKNVAKLLRRLGTLLQKGEIRDCKVPCFTSMLRQSGCQILWPTQKKIRPAQVDGKVPAPHSQQLFKALKWQQEIRAQFSQKNRSHCGCGYKTRVVVQ